MSQKYKRIQAQLALQPLIFEKVMEDVVCLIRWQAAS